MLSYGRIITQRKKNEMVEKRAREQKFLRRKRRQGVEDGWPDEPRPTRCHGCSCRRFNVRDMMWGVCVCVNGNGACRGVAVISSSRVLK